MSQTIIDTIVAYVPYILVAIEFVMIALGNKSNLINGLKTIAQKADEIKESAEMKELQVEINTVIEQNKALLNRISDLTSDVMRLEREVRNKEE